MNNKMKKLFIVRHAKSSWDFPELSDYDRPLNKRGKRNAPEMGHRLATRNVNPDALVTSPAKRAVATARRIADKISFPLALIKKEPQLYHGSINDMIEIIKAVKNDVDILMIFGHNPGLTDLANQLSGSDIYNIPTCGIVEIDFEISSWKDLELVSGKLISFDYPKKIVAA